MTTTTPLLPIEEHVKQAAETIQSVRQSGGNKDLQPMLHLVMPDGTIQLALLAVGGGQEIAVAARAVILQMQPSHAVLMIEAWTHRNGLSKDDPDMRAVMAGVLRPGKLPPHKRASQLTVLGESATGEEAFALFYIEDDGSFTEQHLSWARTADEIARGDGISTRFHPMFMAEAMLREMPAPERAEMLELVGGDEDRLLDAMRQAARRYLASGEGGTTRAFEEQSEEFNRQAREQMGWRRGNRS